MAWGIAIQPCVAPPRLVADAIKLAVRLEDYNLLWLEDPVPPENTDALAKVTAATATPISTGENLYTRFGFRDLVVRQAGDVVSPDIPKVGGLAETTKITDLAEVYCVPEAPHNVSSPGDSGDRSPILGGSEGFSRVRTEGIPNPVRLLPLHGIAHTPRLTAGR